MSNLWIMQLLYFSDHLLPQWHNVICERPLVEIKAGRHWPIGMIIKNVLISIPLILGEVAHWEVDGEWDYWLPWVMKKICRWHPWEKSMCCHLGPDLNIILVMWSKGCCCPRPKIKRPPWTWHRMRITRCPWTCESWMEF